MFGKAQLSRSVCFQLLFEIVQIPLIIKWIHRDIKRDSAFPSHFLCKDRKRRTHGEPKFCTNLLHVLLYRCVQSKVYINCLFHRTHSFTRIEYANVMIFASVFLYLSSTLQNQSDVMKVPRSKVFLPNPEVDPATVAVHKLRFIVLDGAHL